MPYSLKFLKILNLRALTEHMKEAGRHPWLLFQWLVETWWLYACKTRHVYTGLLSVHKNGLSMLRVMMKPF